MIPVPRPSEPPGFDERCRQRGLVWLRKNAQTDRQRPQSYWGEFREDLARASQHRCYWLAIEILLEHGEVEHFIPVSRVRGTGDEYLIYEWTNYRWADSRINQAKGTRDVLDPFDVEEGWFEVSLPDLQIRMTDRIPDTKRALADFTIRQLKLNGEYAIRYRERIFEKYREGRDQLVHVRREAPLLATAIERDLARGVDYRRIDGAN